jgi:ribonuclease Z
MLAQVSAGPYTVRGVSVGGVYTSLQVPELGLVFDCGMALRSLAATDTLLLSHGHADHAGALPALLGIRALHGQKKRLRLVMPVEIVADIEAVLRAMTALQRWPLEIEAIGVAPGDEIELRKDLRIRAIKTYHPVPSLAYQVVRRVSKLRAELHGLSGPEIAARRQAGEDVAEASDHLELAYATDTLIQVLDNEPSLYRSRVLILECTFLDDRKSRDAARAGCHVHLDDIIDRAEHFQNEHLVLMHFSQIYRPDEVQAILERRMPPALYARTRVLVPDGTSWPG